MKTVEDDKVLRTIMIESFEEALDLVLDMAYEDQPCARLMARNAWSGEWTVTSICTGSQVQDVVDSSLDLDDCDMVALELSRDDVNVTLTLDTDTSGRIDVFGGREECARFIGEMLR